MAKEDVDRYLEGYGGESDIQTPPGKSSDPQIVALRSFLSRSRRDGGIRSVADFGSGLGVVAHAIDDVWESDASTPAYFAIDRPEILAKLSLPMRIHNSSQKVSANEYLSGAATSGAYDASLIIVRNVLHELDIQSTARLLRAINSYQAPDADIYIQDIESLVVYERGATPWRGDLLKLLLSELGMKADLLSGSSYSGIGWFACLATPTGADLSSSDVCDLVMEFRRRQSESILEEIEKLRDLGDPKHMLRLLSLSNDYTEIQQQLRGVESSGSAMSPGAVSSAELEVPLSSERFGDLDYALPLPPNLVDQSGLLGVCSRKEILDFPELLRSADEIVYLAGYSQRSLFRHDANVLALRELLERGVDVRLLLVDPESSAAELRGQAIAYDGPDELLGQIRYTLKGAKKFATGGGTSDSKLQVRVTSVAPPCSYLFVDDLCVMSLYSYQTTGNRGPCLLYDGASGAIGSYYQILLREFLSLWGTE